MWWMNDESEMKTTTTWWLLHNQKWRSTRESHMTIGLLFAWAPIMWDDNRTKGFNITTYYIMMKNKQHQSRRETKMYQLPILEVRGDWHVPMDLPECQRIYGAIAPNRIQAQRVKWRRLRHIKWGDARGLPISCTIIFLQDPFIPHPIDDMHLLTI